MSTAHYAFVSYCRENAADVSDLTTKLSCVGIDVRWDKLIPKGANWKMWVRREIEACRAFIICFSAEALNRDETQLYRELNWAIEAAKGRPPSGQFFLPCRFSECTV